MCAEFSASANLDIEINDASVRSAKRRIEDELGTPSVNVRTMAPDGGRSGGGQALGQRAGILDASRQQLEETKALVELTQEQVDILDDLRRGGGGGGGAGGLGGIGGFAIGRSLPTGGGGGGSGLLRLLLALGGAGTVAAASSGVAGQGVKDALNVRATGGRSPATRNTVFDLENFPTPDVQATGESPATRDVSFDLSEDFWPPLPDLSEQEWPPLPDLPDIFGGGGGGGGISAITAGSGPSDALVAAARSPADTSTGIPGQGQRFMLNESEERMILADEARKEGGGDAQASPFNIRIQNQVTADFAEVQRAIEDALRNAQPDIERSVLETVRRELL